MRHFTAELWCDFVRGVAEPGLHTAMRGHLRAGCRRCQARVSWLERLVALARANDSQAPPEHLVRSVKAYFDLDRWGERKSLALLRLPAVYDSGLENASAGARGPRRARHLAYEAGGYTVDLAVGRAAASGESEVEGRLLVEPAEPLTDVPTYVLSRGEVLATAFTGEQGYFSTRCRLGGTCELLFLPERRPAVGVSWESPSAMES